MEGQPGAGTARAPAEPAHPRAGALAAGSGRLGPARVTIALLPSGTPIERLAAVPGLSPGLLSAGLGDVSAEQTYLDIGQGNRVYDSLYDSELPPLGPGEPSGTEAPHWGAIVSRAGSAPADIVPGLLASRLAAARRGGPPRIAAAPGLRLGSLIAADRGGRIERKAADCTAGCAAVAVRAVSVAGLGPLVSRLRGRDLLIALARPPPTEHGQLAIAIAGSGFDGNLTSDSTRTDGYVASTDLAPTILRRLGLPIPSEMSGEPIRTTGAPDFAAVASLGGRLSVIPSRRGSVIGVSLLAWLVAVGLAAAASRGRLAGVSLKLLALAVAYLPLVLLLGAALRPAAGGERLLLGLGAPALGAFTLAAFRGYRALGVACAVTAVGCALDLVAGSPLTSLSLIGPNPGGGFRFFGVGNELEAILAPLVVVGTGAWLAGFAPGLSRGAAAATFLVSGLVFALIFAAGRLGADVGAAISIPAGAAVAAAVIAGRRGLALLAIAIPLAALALLALIDLLSGGDAHLTRSVLDAGGFHDLADVAERRLRLSARSFSRAAGNPIIYVTVGAIALAVLHRERILGWCAGAPAVRAALLGGAAAAVVGTLANDSGALLLEIGTACLLAFCGFAWAERPGPEKVGPAEASKGMRSAPAEGTPKPLSG
ncbi:MAG: hypothetical protein U0R52_11260 [Solirubrobacterales bacterium]